ncbi:WG repeat-containing protein [Ferrimonas sp.]|uniref:WG repeat-containing protein n=1 Tax=Ferrimonas sp. TaxID=2080861 RepID=UPI003A8D4DB1
MHNSLRFIALLLLLHCFPVLAKESKGIILFERLHSPQQYIEPIDAHASLVMDLELHWRAWGLMGEPVIYSEARWRLRGIDLIARGSGEHRWFDLCSDKQSYDCLPDSVTKTIKPVHLKMLVPILRPTHTPLLRPEMMAANGLILDPGVLAESSLRDLSETELSFNTPGSPNWNRSVVSNMHSASQKKLSAEQLAYLPEREAQMLFQHGFELSERQHVRAYPIAFSASFYHFAEYLLEQQRLESEKKLSRAKADRIDAALSTAVQVEEDDIFAEFEREYISSDIETQMQSEESDLQKALEHLQHRLGEMGRQENALLLKRIREIQSRTLPGETLVPVLDEDANKTDSLYGYKRSVVHQEWVIPPRFGFAGDFHQGLALASVGSGKERRYGYINSAGDWVIAPKFEGARRFSEGLAAAIGEGEYGSKRYGYIDTRGEWVIEPAFEDARDFAEGRARVESNYKWGMINSDGSWVILPKFAEMDAFSEGLAVVQKLPGDYSSDEYIDGRGDIALDGRFDEAYPFSEGRARVWKRRKGFGFIDDRGRWIVRPGYAQAEDFSEGLASVQQSRNGLFGYIGPDGHWVIQPRFISTAPFSEGKAAVRIGEDRPLGYIGPDGEWVIRPQFDTAAPFSGGRAVVTFDTRYDKGECSNTHEYWKAAIIDETGQFIVGPESKSRYLGDGTCFKSGFHLYRDNID